VTGFSAEWLALRAPADDAARDPGLITRLTDWAGNRPIKIADLGGGSGAAYRALSSVLSKASWRILDDDPALLTLISKDAEAVQTNLAASTDAAFNPKTDLLTAFAFIDLVSEAWLVKLADRIAENGAAIYAPLTYNGVEIWRPTPPNEDEALTAFNADMRRDKGFGPALGADAAPRLAQLLEQRGYDVSTAQSPWRLQKGPLLTALAEGSASAVSAKLAPEKLATWTAGRLAATTAEIGHIDLLALPKSRTAHS